MDEILDGFAKLSVLVVGGIHRKLPTSDPIPVRAVADGGRGYFRGDHRATLPALRRAVIA